MKTLSDILNTIPRWSSDIQVAVIDLFCGAGGYSWGIKKARIDGKKVCKVVMCVNHDAKAIASHYANMPDALHLTEDIRTVSMGPFVTITEAIRKHHPHIKILLHASLECTNHSKAKGGMSRDADSRTLADHLFRYIEAIRPDYISFENVEEFLIWGPLKVKEVRCKTGDYCPIEIKHRKPTKKNPKTIVSVNPVWIPVKEEKALFYRAWVSKVASYGYTYDYRLLNAADFGAFTSRKRYFGLFALPGLPIGWPEPTHAKKPNASAHTPQKRWKGVREVLSLDILGKSIFTEGDLPVEATLERIFAGCVRIVAGGKNDYLIKYNSMSSRGTYMAPSIDDPCPTVSTQNRIGLIQVQVAAAHPAIVGDQFLSKYFSGHSGSKNNSLDDPAGAITCVDHHSLISARFLAKYYSGNPECRISELDSPSPVLRTKDCPDIVSPQLLLSHHYGDDAKNIDSPCPTLTCKDKLSFLSVLRTFIQQRNGGDPRSKVYPIDHPSRTLTSTAGNQDLIQPIFLANDYSGGGQLGSIDEPTGAILTTPKQNLVSCERSQYLLNPQYSNEGSSVDTPCFTLIARMDKRPPYLLTTETTGEIAPFIRLVDGVLIYEIYESDTPALAKIKEFMALYGIVDIKKRMLLIEELKRIMGLPSDYTLIGNQADQKKFIGNAVETTQAQVNMEAIVSALLARKMTQTA